MPTDPLDLIDEWGPEKVVLVSDPKSGMRGVLVIDNTARGVGKGGTRMSPTLTTGEVARLARTMTWKWAAVDLFHGGAKAGILATRGPATRSGSCVRLLEHWPRSPVRVRVRPRHGPGGGGCCASSTNWRSRRGVGLPQVLGGVPYDKLGVTGFGVAEAADAAASLIDLDLVGARVRIQGFGAVGRAAAARLTDLGAIVVAVSTATGSVHDPNGLDVAELERSGCRPR